MLDRPSGTILVANVDSNSVSLLDEATDKVITEIQVGFNPHEVHVSPNSEYAIVSNFGDLQARHPGNSLTVIDITNAVARNTISLPKASRPHGLKCISDNQVLVTAQGIQSLLVVDFMKGIILNTIPLPGEGAHMVTADAGCNYAYVGCMKSGTVCKIDLVNFSVVKEMKIGASAESVTLTPDETRLLVTNGSDNTVAVLDTNDLSLIKNIKTGYMPVRVAIFNDGQSAVVTNSVSGNAQTIDLNSLTITNTFNTTNTRSSAHGHFFGSLLPVPITIHVRSDQTTAYITNLYAGNISLIDLNKGKILKTFEAANEPDGLDVSQARVQNL